MIRSYFTTAWRSIQKHPGFASINVINLSAGLAVALLILILVWTQFSVDSEHSSIQQVHRVTFSTPPTFSVQSDLASATTPGPLAEYIRRDVPGVQTVSQLREVEERVLVKGKPVNHRGFHADPALFDILDGFRLSSSARAELANPNTAVLTQEAAERMFGQPRPIGERIVLGSGTSYTVKGVVKPTATPSHVSFDVILSLETLRVQDDSTLQDWSTASLYATYLRLDPQVEPADVEKTMQRVAADVYGTESGTHETFQLQGVQEIPFSSALRNDIASRRLPPQALYPLSLLALIVAFTAGFNYATLSITRSVQRTGEAGVRRALGARRRNIIAQFIGESLLVSFLSFIGALLLLFLLIPAFSSLSFIQALGLTLSLSALADPLLLGLCLLACLSVGLLSGLYPAWTLSRSSPADVLSARQGETARKNGSKPSLPFQKSLTVLQFLFSTVVLVTGVVLYRQADHMGNAEYGIETENVLSLSLQNAPYETARQEITGLPGVRAVAATSDLPGDERRMTRAVREPGSEALISIQTFVVDTPFLTDFGLQFSSGAPANLDHYRSGQTLYLNEKAARELGFTDPTSAIGRALDLPGIGTRRIEDIVRDFRPDHIMRVNQPAMILAGNPSQYDEMLINVKPGLTADFRNAMSDLWPKLDQENPLLLRSIDSKIRARSAGITEIAYVLSIAALIAMMISCLGLLGLTAYQVQLRQSEIALRRAIGASTLNIVVLLSKGFLTLVALGVTLGLPIAWVLNRAWLTHFPYRVDLGPATFLACSLGILLIATAAAGSQAIPILRRHPAAGLRDT